jgi:hypothetical protein
MCKRYLNLLGHMRCRSSVLSNILESSGSIYGNREMFMTHHTEDVLFSYGKTSDAPYVYDRILHNKYKVSNDILANPNNKFLFMIRDPNFAIPALIEHGSKFDLKITNTEDKAIVYYMKRVEYLTRMWYHTTTKHFIDSEDLVYNTTQTLQGISEFLELEFPLEPVYDIPKVNHGDVSKFISTGKLIETRPVGYDGTNKYFKWAKFMYDEFLRIVNND